VDGMTCYFAPDANCTLVTGWLNEGGNRYYLGADGDMTVGWAQVGGSRYYFASEGAMHTGWLKQTEGTYYLDADGAMRTGWLELPEGRYYLDENGIVTTGWLEQDGSVYYLNDGGVMVTGWAQVDGARYWFDDDGTVHTGWLALDGARYYLDGSGAMVTGWLDLAEGRYYFGEDGSMATGWLELEGKRYWLKPSGVMHTGWLESPGGLRWFREDGAMAIGRVVIDGVARHFDARGSYVVLVNPWNYVPEDYEVKLVWVEGFQAAAQCADALREMMAACRAAGITCDIDSAYRSHAFQDSIWSGQVERYVARGYSRAYAEALTSKSIAVPGTSEHQLGLAVDLTRENPTYNWLAKHSWEYGFIMRYPYGETDWTGIYYEPWHYRYVGKELAKELYDLGLCLEEYMDMLTQQAGYGDN